MTRETIEEEEVFIANKSNGMMWTSLFLHHPISTVGILDYYRDPVQCYTLFFFLLISTSLIRASRPKIGKRH